MKYYKLRALLKRLQRISWILGSVILGIFFTWKLEIFNSDIYHGQRFFGIVVIFVTVIIWREINHLIFEWIQTRTWT